MAFERRSEHTRDLQHLLHVGAELALSTTHDRLHAGWNRLDAREIAVAHQLDHFADEERVAAGALMNGAGECERARRATRRRRLLEASPSTTSATRCRDSSARQATRSAPESPTSGRDVVRSNVDVFLAAPPRDG